MMFIVALGTLVVAFVGTIQKRGISRIGKKQKQELVQEAEKQEEISYLWNKAGQAYSSQDYETAAEIWQNLSKDHNLENRPFFNNWGSTLLNLAKQKSQGDPEREALLKEAAAKYKRAESFTQGTAAYNLASVYALLSDEENCRKWLSIATETGRILPRKRVLDDEDLRSMRDKDWFGKLLRD